MAKEKSVNSFKFNFNLLIVDDKPLEFCVEGYQLEYFLGLIKLIEVFGGKLSSRHAPDVIIFSDPDNLPGRSSHQHYDVKFLHDSIAIGKLQNLENYRITSSEGQELENSAVQRRRTIEKQKRSNIVNYEDVRKPSGSRKIDVKTKVEKDSAKKNEKALKSCSRPSISCLKSSTWQGNGKKLRVMIPKLGKQLVKSRFSNEELTKARIPISSRRSVTKVDRNPLMDDNISEISKSETGNRGTSLLPSSNKKIIKKMPKIQLLQKGQKLKRSKLGSNRYTERDNCRLIEYLTKKNIVHLGAKLATWNEFLKNEVLDKRNPSILGLVKHFRSVLRDRCSNFSKNAATVRPREPASKAVGKKPRKRFSETEYKIMIDFLINNDLIHRALGSVIWRECLMKNQLLQKSGRTSLSLSGKFRDYLRYNYAKYTSDPEALKKFKELEMRG